jgi:hypothetical protein
MVKFLWKEGTDVQELQQGNLKLERTEIHDIHRIGRPIIDHVDDDIMVLLRTFPLHIVRTPAETLRVSSSTILHPLRGSLGSTASYCRCVPHELASHLKEKRVVMCRELLELLEMEETVGVARRVSRDGSWLYLNYSHSHLWSESDDEPPVRVDQTMTSESICSLSFVPEGPRWLLLAGTG